MPVTPALILENRPRGRIRPELDCLSEVLAARGNPQFDVPSILVVGTNGKGSTAAMLEAMLRAHDLRTGLFTSPHLVRVEERIRLNGEPVAGDVLGEHIGRFDASPDLTYFETLTAAAFTIFSDLRIDVAVLEAGMGGSWDATRVAKSTVAGLTNVGSDHAGWLGSKRFEIARDKGRALAAANHAIIGPGVEDALIPALGAPHARRARSLASCRELAGGRVGLRWDGRSEMVVHLPLLGVYQLENLEVAMALAIEANRAGLVPTLKPDRVRSALETVSWPGRLSVHLVGGRQVTMDCAHNLEAVVALASHLEGVDHRYNLLFSCLDDKPAEAMARVLAPRVAAVTVCPLNDERAMPLDRLAAAFPCASIAHDPRSALDTLDDPVLVAGSARLVGALLALTEAGEAE
jgi:dihydrofolate synthase/folylpolyglutamate synthase